MVFYGAAQRVDARFHFSDENAREDGPASHSQLVVVLATELVSLKAALVKIP